MRKALIVDDHENIRKLLKTTLKMFSFNFFTAENGLDALEIANKEIPEIIILDVMMPGKLNGFQVLKQLHDNKTTSNCKIIMLTGRNDDQDIKKAMEQGAGGYLVKPFHPVELVNLVEKLL